LLAAHEVSPADVAAALPLTRREVRNELEQLATDEQARRLTDTLYAPAA
jgi:hypothetical protein